MEVVREHHVGRVDAAELLLASTGSGRSDHDEAQLLEALAQMFTWYQLFLPEGTLDSTMESQGLTLLRNPTLRLELVNWVQGLERVDESNDFLVEMVTDLTIYLKPRFPVRILDTTVGRVRSQPISFYNRTASS